MLATQMYSRRDAGGVSCTDRPCVGWLALSMGLLSSETGPDCWQKLRARLEYILFIDKNGVVLLQCQLHGHYMPRQAPQVGTAPIRDLGGAPSLTVPNSPSTIICARDRQRKSKSHALPFRSAQNVAPLVTQKVSRFSVPPPSLHAAMPHERRT